MPDITVHAVGEQCPIPVVKAAQALEELTGPGVVEVLCHVAVGALWDPRINFPAWNCWRDGRL